ncbi:hypothetical protein VCRA2119O44_370028 [Vibrio crassostreae]|nr:hypothetical protein VCRA2119O47_360029 [Vibrio crassostreae]CAK2060847.1 hypothetical protein VCRA2119O44_370028 [Vibrio crassostreae]CAK2349488.1 hypothetical protein VCRA2119O50_360001 [Vibrio crassostreae]CAK3895931.1 hypothetical protein VCRA218O18_350001 [Vibrio crassostreae]
MTKKYPKRGSSIFKYNYATKPISYDEIYEVFNHIRKTEDVY